jgi:hypothetical protein
MTLPEALGPSAADVVSCAVRETLLSYPDVNSCMALASRMAHLMGAALEYFQRQRAGIACQAGCAFCCHLRVMVYPHEAIALFGQLASRMPAQQAHEVQERLLTGHSPASTAGHPAPCAFLVDGRCSAYEVRPATCAGFHSVSRGHCQRLLDRRASLPVGIPASRELQDVAVSLHQALGRAVAEAGLSSAQVELRSAVAALLRQPELVERWRSGGEWTRDAHGVVVD